MCNGIQMPFAAKFTPLFEIALVLVHFDHVVSFIVNEIGRAHV